MHGVWWWADRWRKSTAYGDMTAEEQGLYRNLLDELWLRPNHAIPDDQRILAKASGDHEAWQRSGTKVLRWMTLTSEGWTNETALDVIRQSQGRAERQARYRQRNAARNGPHNGGHNEGHSPDPSPSPDPSLITNHQSPEKKSRRSRGAATWLTPFADVWRSAYGGDLNFGEAGKALKKPVSELGSDEVVARLRRFCSTVSGQYASIAKFASTVGSWQEGQNGNGHSMTAAEKTAANVRKMLAEAEAEEKGT